MRRRCHGRSGWRRNPPAEVCSGLSHSTIIGNDEGLVPIAQQVCGGKVNGIQRSKATRLKDSSLVEHLQAQAHKLESRQDELPTPNRLITQR